MARPPPGRCVHCVAADDHLTWDHVFPESWYPKTTPPNLEKWKIPACLKCNHEYGLLEDDLLTTFALCLDPDHPDTADVVARGLRAIDPDVGRNGKDRKKRAQRRIRILKMMEPASVLDHAIVPNFGRNDVPEGETGALRVKAHHLRRFSEKIVRGLSYLEDGIFIEPPHHIHFYLLRDADAEQLVATASRFGKTLAREPGIEVVRAVTPDDGVSSLYAITVWNRLKMYSVVDQRGDT